MAEIDTSIYKQPPPPNPLEGIIKTGQAADALGNIAVGQSVQGALDPNSGEIDANKLANLLRQTTPGAMKAIPTLDALAKLKQANFATDQAGLETFQKRMALTNHLFSGIASKDKPTIDDVYDAASLILGADGKMTEEAKKHGITLPTIMNTLKQFRGPDGKPLSSEQIKQKALEIQTQAATTSEVLSQHSPSWQWVNRGNNLELVPTGTPARPATGTTVPLNLPPTTEEVLPSGAKRLIGEQPSSGPAVVPPPRADVRVGPPLAADKNQGRAPVGQRPIPPIVPSGPASALPAGQQEAYSVLAQSGAKSAAAVIEANDSSMTRKGMLGNLEDDLTKFTAGKGADWSLVAKNFANRNLPMPKSWQEAGGPFDARSVASQEQFNKQAMQLAQAQFAAIGGTGTDAKFGSAFETSPNETLSQMGNQGIIRLLKGNEDAIQAKAKAWRDWRKSGNGPDTWGDFSADFNNDFDPRAFQFKYLKPAERQEYIEKMDQQDRQQFVTSLTAARKKGWIKF